MIAYIPQQEIDNIDRVWRKIERFVFWSTPGQHELSRQRSEAKRDCKWAWMMIGNTRKICFIDKKTGVAYKADNDRNATWIKWPVFKFERWCTGLDL